MDTPTPRRGRRGLPALLVVAIATAVLGTSSALAASPRTGLLDGLRQTPILKVDSWENDPDAPLALRPLTRTHGAMDWDVQHLAAAWEQTEAARIAAAKAAAERAAAAKAAAEKAAAEKAAAEKAAAAKAAAEKSQQTYAGTNHVWMPSLGLSRGVEGFSCSRSTPPGNTVYRWGCAGANNVYLFGHAWGVFKPLHDAYYNGRLKKGMVVVYADSNGKVRTYRVTEIRIVTPDQVSWAIAAQARPSMTLQTCIGANSEKRLLVRLVADS